MKKILFILTCIPVLAFAQSADQNYVKTTTYKAAHYGNPQIQISYLDGLGRPLQQVAHQQSNSGKDIVTHIEYDAFGRQVKDFLPYVNQTASLNYNSSADLDVLGFYDQDYYENTLNPFSEKQLESSPLNRVFKQAAPGTPWILNPRGFDRSIKFEYWTNRKDEVKLYKANAIWNEGEGLYEAINLVQVNNYADGKLYKTITKDENWTAFSGKNNTTEEFKDMDGRLILKRAYNVGETYDTYYVYDQFGNLTFVIPPLVNTQQTITQEILDGICYQYKYDHRNRLVSKRLPGKQWEFIVYDKTDRIVSTGPILNPWGSEEYGWMFTKYDALNRVAYTGWHMLYPTTSAGRKQLATQYQSIPLSEVRNDGLDYDGVTINYSNEVFPKVGKLLTVNYYDDYDYPNAPENIPSTILSGNQEIYYNNIVLPIGMSTGSWVRMLTSPEDIKGETEYSLYDSKGRIVRTWNSNDFLGGYTQIDSQIDFSGKVLLTETKHRRTESDSELTILDTYQYTPQDRLLLHKQQINGGSEELIAKNTYDELGQLISKKVGGGDATGNTSLQNVDYSYNIRGWLNGINNEQPSNQEGLVMGESDLFGMKINYTKLEGEVITNVNKLYNGNIAEILWKTSSDNYLRKYSYQYDNLNRLIKGIYQKPTLVVPVTNSYNEELGYDKNGNIQYLLRNGDRDSDWQDMGALLIDDLIYSYKEESPNQLTKVFDKSGMSQGFKDDSDGITDSADDYKYDLNGNLKVDSNKAIIDIMYNHLNLPTKILFQNSNFIEYIYTATGKKFSKKVVDNTSIGSKVEYLNGFQYKEGVLQFFAHPEGYVNVTIGGESETSVYYNYVYNYTDHLGNVRLSYGVDPSTSSLKIIEENHYYPFGLKHTNYNSDWLMYYKQESGGIRLREPIATLHLEPSYKYKYNGKELQDELGLNMYDYGARNYDPAIGRWNVIDPLADKFSGISPYNYVMNNPISLVDPDGMAPGDPVGPGYIKAGGLDRMIGFTVRHPIAAAAIGSVSHGSNNISTNSARFAINTGLPENKAMEGSHINAFRHTLWQATITNEFGESTAKQAGNTHEDNPFANLSQTSFKSLSEADQSVDLLNNQIGRQIGKDNPDASMKQLAIETLNYFNDNGLYTATKQKDGTYSVSQTKLTSEQYSSALKTLNSTNQNGYTPAQQTARNAEVNEAQALQNRMHDRGSKF